MSFEFRRVASKKGGLTNVTVIPFDLQQIVIDFFFGSFCHGIPRSGYRSSVMPPLLPGPFSLRVFDFASRASAVFLMNGALP